jgi:hypothetical protein
LITILVLEKNADFCRKLLKIVENYDHNIDPWPKKCSGEPLQIAGGVVMCFLRLTGRGANPGSFDLVYFLIPSGYNQMVFLHTKIPIGYILDGVG